MYLHTCVLIADDMRAAVVRPWDGNDCSGYAHRASILFDVPDTLWWRGSSVPDTEHRARAAQCIASAVAVARTTCLPDVQLEHGSPGPITRVSQRRSHASTHIAYFESGADPLRAWVVIYGPVPLDSDRVKDSAHVSANGELARAQPSCSEYDNCDVASTVVTRATLEDGPSAAHVHALSSMLSLDRQPSIVIERPASVTRITGLLGDDSFDWIDLMPVSDTQTCRVLDDLVASSENDGPLVAWLSTRLVLRLALELGFDIPHPVRDPSSDLAVDLRLRARGLQIHVPPRQAALDAFRQSVVRALGGDKPSGDSDMDAFVQRIIERVCAHACIK